jgi:peptidoglycan/LPS O-acetylase OafA/YrhL
LKLDPEQRRKSLSAGPPDPVRTRAQERSGRGFNQNVHGARGLFASAVFLFHVINSGLATYPLLMLPIMQFILRTPEYGVELFFCISGFVIVGTLRRASSPGAFLEDRAIRIFPVLGATVVVIAILGFATRTYIFGDWTPGRILLWLPANLLALPGIFPFPEYHPAAWSLSYEMAFYTACAAGWWARSWRPRIALWPAVPMAAIFLAFYPRALLFLPGVLVAVGGLESRRIAWLTRFPIPMTVIFLLAWHGIQELSPVHMNQTTLFDWAHDGRMPLAALAIVAAGLAFAGLVSGTGLLGRFLRQPILQYLGTVSYSFYLWHPIAMSAVKHEMLRSGLAAAAGENAQLLFLFLSLPPSLVLAHVSQRLLERDVALWLRRRLHHPAPLASVAPTFSPMPQPTETPAIPAGTRKP